MAQDLVPERTIQEFLAISLAGVGYKYKGSGFYALKIESEFFCKSSSQQSNLIALGTERKIITCSEIEGFQGVKLIKSEVPYSSQQEYYYQKFRKSQRINK